MIRRCSGVVPHCHDAVIGKDGATALGDFVVDLKGVVLSGIIDTLTEVEPSSAVEQRGFIGVVANRSEMT